MESEKNSQHRHGGRGQGWGTLQSAARHQRQQGLACQDGEPAGCWRGGESLAICGALDNFEHGASVAQDN